ncbi:MAG: tRNA guanosine(34) transglycosylase Tgt [Bacteroidetes bacterium]|nr:tRNA guanosine(34) transglycosylase Tgt [Bacteroidota bacterium]
MGFELITNDSSTSARAGRIHTGHGVINTPAFMPVGTSGSVKGVHQRELAEDIRAQIILTNTYHLYLRPGSEIISKAGGVHKFIGWHKPVLTDSGGFQVYSLGAIRKITDDGVEFSSHIDGSKHFFTPEKAVQVQREIGADIIMAFDECVSYPCEESDTIKSMERTHRWLERCMKYFNENPDLHGYPQTIIPIVQGNIYKNLRQESASFITTYPSPGYAIGGLSVGEPDEMLYEITAYTCSLLPQNNFRYLMGVGTPENLLECISVGVDLFDCVIPTRNARNGMLFTKNGILHIKNNRHKDDFSPLDPDGTSFADRQYSRAYLRHLFNVNERLAAMIASVHNLRFYQYLMEEARKNIIEGTFNPWKKEMMESVGRDYP